MTRIPNTSSPEEVRRAFQRLGATTASLASGISSLGVRVATLEDAADVHTAEAVESITAGDLLYGVLFEPRVGVARADTFSKSGVVGVALNTVEAGFAVRFAASGRIVVSPATLTPNTVYFLGETGGLTTVAPTAAGLILAEVARATEEDVLSLSIKRPIRL